MKEAPFTLLRSFGELFYGLYKTHALTFDHQLSFRVRSSYVGFMCDIMRNSVYYVCIVYAGFKIECFDCVSLKFSRIGINDNFWNGCMVRKSLIKMDIICRCRSWLSSQWNVHSVNQINWFFLVHSLANK